MVKSKLYLTLAIASSLALSGCGLKHYLVSPPPPPKVVDEATAETSSSGGGSNCADWKKILEGSQEESISTFECYAKKVNSIWTQIKGSKPDQLTDNELILVLRRNIIVMPGNREEWTNRVMAAKSLLGMGPVLSRAELDVWVTWLRQNRADIRDLYIKLYTRPSTSVFYYTDSQKLALLGASFLRQMNWSKSSTELSELILKVMPFKDWQFIQGMETGVRVGRNFIGYICPLQSAADHVDTNEIAACLENAQGYFQPTARWFEFMINDKSVFLSSEIPDIQSALDAAVPLIASWSANSKLQPIDTQLWYNWAKMIGANPPSDFIASLNLLTRLSGKSTELSLSPLEITKFFGLIHTYHSSLLNAISVYSAELESGNCANKDASSWKNCILGDSRVATARSQSATIDNAFRVKNPANGQTATPYSGSEIDLIAFFDATSQLVMSMFDSSNTGVITANLGDDNDQVVKLITTSVNVYRAVDLYIGNLSLRLDGTTQGFATQAGPNLGQWDINGFSRLLAIASDVLVIRTPEQLNVIEKFLANITNDFPSSSQTLDRPAITAILTAISSLPSYRQTALAQILGSDEAAQLAMQNNQPIDRTLFEKNLGKMLAVNFPRTYEKCMEFGFDISCQIAFAQVMPSTDDSRKQVNPSDIDVLTILAMGLEGVFDNCGKGDGTLSLSIGNGDDQLDCGFTRLKDGVERLIDAKIIKTSTLTSLEVTTVLGSVNSIFLTRTPGKEALIRGTTASPLMSYFLVFRDKTATFGSSYALLSTVIAPDQVKAIKKSKK